MHEQRKSDAAPIGALALLTILWMLTTAATDSASHCSPISPECATLRIDPNCASADELMLLPGVGPTFAQRIIQEREQSAAPAFERTADLLRIRGFGPAKLEAVRPFLIFAHDDEPVFDSAAFSDADEATATSDVEQP